MNWSWDLAAVLAITAIAGAVGGLVHELLRPHGKQEGMLELPHREQRSRFLDLGWWAPVIVGAVTAMGLLYFVSPGQTITVETATGVTTTTTYDLIKTVALALLAGSAGASLLTSLQSRVKAIALGNDLTRTQAISKATIEQQNDQHAAALKASEEDVKKLSAEVRTVVERAASQLPRQIAEAGPEPEAITRAVDEVRQTAGPADPGRDAQVLVSRLEQVAEGMTSQLDKMAVQAEDAKKLITVAANGGQAAA